MEADDKNKNNSINSKLQQLVIEMITLVHKRDAIIHMTTLPNNPQSNK
jgi:hypothetical protein